VPPGSDEAKPFSWGSDEARPALKVSGEAEPSPLGSIEARLPLWSVGTAFHTKGPARFVIMFLTCRKASS
jgi:hypothetical protein